MSGVPERTIDDAPQEKTARWPAEKLYWAVLETGRLPRRWGRSEGLGYLLEPFLPVPLESVHAVTVALDRSRTLACAAPREALEEEISRGTLSLTPASAPAFVEDRVEVGRLELLSGPFRPPRLRALDRRWVLFGTLLALGALLVALAGIKRRIARVESDRALVVARAEETARGVLDSPLPGEVLPLSLQLEAESRRLRQTRALRPEIEEIPKVGPNLARLLALWPRELHVATDSLTVTPETIHLRAGVPSNEVAQELASALGTLEGWELSPPSVRTSHEGVQVSLRLQKKPAEPRETP